MDPLLFTPRKIDVEMILKKVSNSMDIPVEAILNKSRKRELVIARQITMTLAKKYTTFSLAKIGQDVAGKDHATVLHACKTINNLIDTKDYEVTRTFIPIDLELRRILNDIRNFKVREPLFVVVNEELFNINALNDYDGSDLETLPN